MSKLVLGVKSKSAKKEEYLLHPQYTLDDVQQQINLAIERQGAVVLLLAEGEGAAPSVMIKPKRGGQIYVRDTEYF